MSSTLTKTTTDTSIVSYCTAVAHHGGKRVYYIPKHAGKGLKKSNLTNEEGRAIVDLFLQNLKDIGSGALKLKVRKPTVAVKKLHSSTKK